MIENLKLRFEKRWIRPDQLDVYVSLGIITLEEKDYVMGLTPIEVIEEDVTETDEEITE